MIVIKCMFVVIVNNMFKFVEDFEDAAFFLFNFLFAVFKVLD